MIESHIRSLVLSSNIEPNGTGALVVRSGALGACVGAPKRNGEVIDVDISWIPAYWRQEERAEVKDVTGGEIFELFPFIILHFPRLP